MSRESLVLNGIKDFQLEYPDGVPVSILRLDLNLSDDDLKVTLLSLEGQGVIFIEEEYVKLVEQVSEDEMVMEAVIEAPDETLIIDEGKLKDLTERELEAYRIIEGLAGDSKQVSKYILEGNLLFGDLKLSSLGTYKLILSLENKGVIKRIQLNDGEYYTI